MGKTNIPITKTRSYNVSVAADVGINAAVLFENICFWVEKNKANKKNFINGTYWTYNSINAFVELFPEMTYNQIDYALRKLKDKGYIKWASLNEDVFKRTKYYTVCDFDKWILHTESEEESENKNNEQEEDNSNSILEFSETISENSESSLENPNMFNIYNNINNNSDNYITDNNDTDNDSNSLSTDKDNSKTKVLEPYNSPVSEETKQETHVSKTLGRKTHAPKQAPLKDMPTRAREIAGRLVDDTETADKVSDCISYFLEQYKAHSHKEHIHLTNDKLHDVVVTMLSTITIQHENDSGIFESDYNPLVADNVDIDDMKCVIDEYFQTQFREKTDYSLVHFTQEGVLTNVMNKCMLGGNPWYESHSL